MKTASFCTLIIGLTLSAGALASGVGYSTFPLAKNKKMISTEMTGDLSNDGGMGLQARFITRPSSLMGIIDAGIGISGGERDFSLFAGYDHELYPDYKNQPRFSVKGMAERVTEYGDSKNKITFSPNVTKGFSFWGYEGYPYIGMPMGLALNTSKGTYENVAELAMGLSGKFPVRGYTHLTANIEASVNVLNSYSGVSVGISYPIN
ncbi:MAG: hypothetical protein KAG61_05895 [Bacteriovoracaceae bacterium]|nr:hypothetical protein [Bacteriovoracaceae bacterium]